MTDKLDLSIKLTECPICGEVLQATHVYEEYTTVAAAKLVATESGPKLVIDEEKFQYVDPQWVETRIYCDSDHKESDIIAKLAELVS